MPVTPTYPGVYIEEVPSGVRTIVGVSTSATAFLGYFHRGPLNTPLRCFNLGDFEREFGGLHSEDEAGYAIQQFFLNGGSEAWVVRVAGGDPAASEVTLQDEAGSPTLRVFAGRRFRGNSVPDPGTWGDALRIEVDYDTVDPSDAELFNMVVSEVAVRDGRRTVLRSESYVNVSIDPDSPSYVVEKVNEDSKLIQVERVNGAARPAQTGTTGIAIADATPFSNATQLSVSVTTSDGASGPFDLTLDELPDPGDAVTIVGAAPAIRRALERAIRAEGTDQQNPYLAGASVTLQAEPGGGRRLRVLAGGDSRGDFEAEAILTFDDDGASGATDLGLVTGTAVENVQQYSLGTGTDGMQEGDQQGDGGSLPDQDALIGNFDDKTGIYALRDVDIFNIVCIPGAVAETMTDENAAAVYAAAESFCEAERAFLIVDIPIGVNEISEVQNWLEDANIRHRNAAVYFPRVRIPDPRMDNRLRSVGASGTMAGLYARTDGARGVWKAPAGIEAVLRNVQDFDAKLTDPENGVINKVGINALRQFPIYGRVSWGGRTLEGADVQASEWKYIPVRRLALFLEESLYRGLQWVVFEPNDEPLWSQIRLNVGGFMHNLFRQGAFQGTSPKDAYFVKCDSETTTQNDINLGIVNVLVGFAPLKPAEFVIIKIQQMAGQVQT
ncbi:MAG: phage tail protein [Actinobacteria bacterium]|nr:phage tail protein [Actinomycetota bacterium]